MAFFRKQQEEQTSMPQELIDLRASIDEARLPENVSAVALKELERLEKTDPSAAEYAVGLNYIDYLISLPWNRYTDDNLDLNRAEQILNRYHYGLLHAKQRVLEYLAVRALAKFASIPGSGGR